MLSERDAASTEDKTTTKLSELQLLVAILVLSAVARLVFVFGVSDYTHYLVSDMAGYWSRAVEYADGNTPAYNQWRLSPRFPHAVLGDILVVLRQFKLSDVAQLQVVLLLNVGMSVASAYFVFEIGKLFTKSGPLALVSAALFAFFPTLIYYNAFVLSENPTIFAVVLSLYLTLKYRERVIPLILAGAALGCATMFRTAVGLIGPPCVLYILAASRFNLRAMVRAVWFSVGYCVVVVVAVANVYQVSEGRLLGVSAVGGLNFFFMNCKVRQVTTTYQLPHHYTIPPSRDRDYERERFITEEPYHNQTYFFGLGAECIRENPGVLLTNLLEVRHLFFTNFFPALFPRLHEDAWRFTIRDVSQLAVFGMFASLGLFPLLYRRQDRDPHIATLFLAIVAVEILTMSLFLFEHRYVYPFLGFVIIPCVAIVATVANDLRRYGVIALGYVLSVGALAALLVRAANS